MDGVHLLAVRPFFMRALVQNDTFTFLNPPRSSTRRSMGWYIQKTCWILPEKDVEKKRKILKSIFLQKYVTAAYASISP